MGPLEQPNGAAPMPGILSGGPGAPPAAPPGPPMAAAPGPSGPPPGAGGGGGDEQANVSPEEQAMYDTIVINAKQLIWGPESSDAVLGKIQAKMSSEAPATAIGAVGAEIGAQMAQAAEGAGVQLLDEVMFHAGNEVVGDLVQLAKHAGLVQAQGKEEEQLVEASFFEATRIYGEQLLKSGKVGPEQRAQLGQVVGGLQGSFDSPESVGKALKKQLAGGGAPGGEAGAPVPAGPPPMPGGGAMPPGGGAPAPVQGGILG